MPRSSFLRGYRSLSSLVRPDPFRNFSRDPHRGTRPRKITLSDLVLEREAYILRKPAFAVDATFKRKVSL